MDLENLKPAYQNKQKTGFSKEGILKMISKSNPPAAKSIKAQLIIETVFWTVFTAVYYDFFDGHLKPVLWNFLLLAAVCFILTHNALGFKIVNNPINGQTIVESLKNYQGRIKTYAVVSIVSRVLAIAILLGYFISTITLTNEKIISLGFIAFIFPVQIYLLNRVWKKRKDQINKILIKLQE